MAEKSEIKDGLDTWNRQRTSKELGAFVARLQGNIDSEV